MPPCVDVWHPGLALTAEVEGSSVEVMCQAGVRIPAEEEGGGRAAGWAGMKLYSEPEGMKY